jgi:hypothetical protein
MLIHGHSVSPFYYGMPYTRSSAARIHTVPARWPCARSRLCSRRAVPCCAVPARLSAQLLRAVGMGPGHSARFRQGLRVTREAPLALHAKGELRVVARTVRPTVLAKRVARVRRVRRRRGRRRGGEKSGGQSGGELPEVRERACAASAVGPDMLQSSSLARWLARWLAVSTVETHPLTHSLTHTLCGRHTGASGGWRTHTP